MSDVKIEELPWNFEAFRSFLSYDVVQQAASVLCLFEDKNLFSSPKNLFDFQRKIKERTGQEWIPKRNVSEEILFNVEGNIFRNKARVFTSLYLIDPSSLKEQSVLRISSFCKALGYGYISEQDFYRAIVSRFEYPHPAYDTNWKSWSRMGLSLKPFIFILQILAHLFQLEKTQAYLKASEFAFFAHPSPYHEKAEEIAKAILASRQNGKGLSHSRTDKVDRKISDLFGFLCISGFCFYDRNNVNLNLLGVHPKEKTHFFESRLGVSTLKDLLTMIESSIRE